MSDHSVSRRHFFFGTLLAGAVPGGGFGSTPSLKTLGYKSPNEKLNIAAIGAGGKGAATSRLRRPRTSSPCAIVDDKRAAAIFKQYREGAEVQRLPQDARQGRQEYRRGDRHHPGPHARHGGDVAHGARQARLRAEAADAHRLGSAAADGSRRQIQGRDADGQPGLLERRHAAVRRDDLGRRDRQRHRSACLDRPSDLAAGPDRDSAAGCRCLSTLDWDLWLGGAEMRPFSPAARASRTGATSTSPSTGAASTTSAAARSATWRATFWVRRTWRCSLGAPTSVECIKKEGESTFMFPKKSVIRFDFPARGNMPPRENVLVRRATDAA